MRNVIVGMMALIYGGSHLIFYIHLILTKKIHNQEQREDAYSGLLIGVLCLIAAWMLIDRGMSGE